jgi:hypothetical protein
MRFASDVRQIRSNVFAVFILRQFVAAMAITTGVFVVGAMAWVFVVGRVEQVNWAAKVEVSMAATTTST